MACQACHVPIRELTLLSCICPTDGSWLGFARPQNPALTPAASSLQAMFPNCSRHACNDYPTCSGTRVFCNESLPNVDTWPLCINGLSKSVARTDAVAELSLHIHNVKEGE